MWNKIYYFENYQLSNCVCVCAGRLKCRRIWRLHHDALTNIEEKNCRLSKFVDVQHEFYWRPMRPTICNSSSRHVFIENKLFFSFLLSSHSPSFDIRWCWPAVRHLRYRPIASSQPDTHAIQRRTSKRFSPLNEIRLNSRSYWHLIIIKKCINCECWMLRESRVVVVVAAASLFLVSFVFARPNMLHIRSCAFTRIV